MFPIRNLVIAVVLLVCQASATIVVVGGHGMSSTIPWHRRVKKKVAEDKSKKSEREECNEVQKCEMCTFSDQKAIPACKETGRKQKIGCLLYDANDADEVKGKNAEFRSCKQTEADEEFAMIRLQMFCLLVGSMAFMQVRKQKRVNVSLFDQRNQAQAAAVAAAQQKRGRRNSGAMEEEIEFTKMTNQETVPLMDTSSNPLEVI